jgi:hypothetical protein
MIYRRDYAGFRNIFGQWMRLRKTQSATSRRIPGLQEPASPLHNCTLAAARISLVRFTTDAATRGWASSRFVSASVAALTCVRVLLRDRFVFSMVHLVTNDLLKSVPFGVPVPSSGHKRAYLGSMSMMTPERDFPGAKRSMCCWAAFLATVSKLIPNHCF